MGESQKFLSQLCTLPSATLVGILHYFNWYVQLRNPKEVTTEDYNEFYKKTFNEYLDPLASSHFTTEVLTTTPLL